MISNQSGNIDGIYCWLWLLKFLHKWIVTTIINPIHNWLCWITLILRKMHHKNLSFTGPSGRGVSAGPKWIRMFLSGSHYWTLWWFPRKTARWHPAIKKHHSDTQTMGIAKRNYLLPGATAPGRVNIHISLQKWLRGTQLSFGSP